MIGCQPDHPPPTQGYGGQSASRRGVPPPLPSPPLRGRECRIPRLLAPILFPIQACPLSLGWVPRDPPPFPRGTLFLVEWVPAGPPSQGGLKGILARIHRAAQPPSPRRFRRALRGASAGQGLRGRGLDLIKKTSQIDYWQQMRCFGTASKIQPPISWGN